MLRDDDELALILTERQNRLGRPLYVDQLQSVPVAAVRWLRDGRNNPVACATELDELLAGWPEETKCVDA